MVFEEEEAAAGVEVAGVAGPGRRILGKDTMAVVVVPDDGEEELLSTCGNKKNLQCTGNNCST